MARNRAVILISGRGSNMAALVEAARDPSYPVEIAGVISDKADAAGLTFAAKAGIATRVVAKTDRADKAALDEATEEALRELGAEIVCLAGYMRLLGADFVQKWQGRLINIHPSLLPLFKGLDTHRAALDAGVRVHGCTVHFVTADMDGGPIIAQAAVPVEPQDDESALAARVLAAEHRLYPLALRMVAEGKARMEGGRTVYPPFATTEAGRKAVVLSPEPMPDAVDLEALARFTP